MREVVPLATEIVPGLADSATWYCGGYGAIRGASFYATYQMNLPRPLVSIGRGFFEEAVAMRPA